MHAMPDVIAQAQERGIPATPRDQLGLMAAFQRESLGLPQIDPETQHMIHAGVYHRTVRMPANTVLIGALVKIPTVVTISGDVTVAFGYDLKMRYCGYRVLSAQANRKQAFIAHAETFITMSFRTDARDVAEAEAEFTDEHTLLQSRRFGAQITG